MVPIVSSKGEIFVVKVSDIISISAMDGEIEIRTKTRKGRPLRSLMDYEQYLLPLGFERASKSELVNTNQIWRFCEQNQTLYFDKKRKIKGIKVSRRNQRKFKAL
ncbi:LytTR family DNA-binding domain-containing protein [Paenibacillus polymyxa]|uniref:LytTR family DNA-binding domain-containing protein n=1 Tax=Paenibacillus polymyxa TaxID=1406 RepID=UPI002AB5DA1D|nr:LytTR family DNA-binding domain-containing protein [Paenibacillus polymyxa]MDY7989797.1 LytTR family DNA-binding domain-containing protein [Paenibacillus polymyxa]MDY8116844.1 LytTR family DNA-binding domain-containing protein [Paenibacillus polymyxa]